MRYHYQPPKKFGEYYGQLYICNHPVYNRCTLYLEGNIGLAVIQQKYDVATKHTYWQEIDPEFRDVLYLNNSFPAFFDSYAAKMDSNLLYPTVTLRQIMWYMRLKPLKREAWETTFDKKPI